MSNLRRSPPKPLLPTPPARPDGYTTPSQQHSRTTAAAPDSPVGRRGSRSLLAAGFASHRSESPTGPTTFPVHAAHASLEAVSVRSPVNNVVQEQKYILRAAAAPPPPSPTHRYRSPRAIESTGSSHYKTSDTVEKVSRRTMTEFRRAHTKFHWPGDPHSSHVDVSGNDPFPLRRSELIAVTDHAVVHACGADDSVNGFDDLVAVKCIKITKKGNRAEELDKVREEVRNLQGLSHPHIIALLGSFTHLNQFGIVMFPVAPYYLEKYMLKTCELIESNDTTAFRVMLERLRTFMPCLCSALNYLHTLERKIKHRDIKPQNILVDQHGNVLLTDFGISKRYDPTEAVTTTGPGQSLTVMYAAPEVRQGSRSSRGLDIDVFSLGCVFLEMATILAGSDTFALCESVGSMKTNPDTGAVSWKLVYADALDKVPYWILGLKSRAFQLRLLNDLSDGGLVRQEHCNVCLDPEQLTAIGRMIGAKRGDRPSLPMLRDILGRESFKGERFERESSRRCCYQESSLDVVAEESGRTSPALKPVSALPLTLAHAEHESAAVYPSTRTSSLSIDDMTANQAREHIPRDGSDTPHVQPLVETNNKANIVAPNQRFKRQRLHAIDPLASEKGDEILLATPVNASRSSSFQLTHSRSTGDVERSREDDAPDFDPRVRIYYPSKRSQIVLQDGVEGKRVLVYDRENDTLEAILQERFDFTQKGIWLPLPRGDGWNYRALFRDINLWKRLPLRTNLSRVVGSTKFLFIRGNFPDEQLLARDRLDNKRDRITSIAFTRKRLLRNS